uniref:Quaking_NLS domain-containing protein n=1 Tax=Macrostomum lignano TaxID=282301 RepID=A0A1I8H9T1_9PLAT
MQSNCLRRCAAKVKLSPHPEYSAVR